MYFIISKILNFLVSPFLWLALCVIIALLYRRQKRRRFFLQTSIIILLLFSNTAIFEAVIKKWEIPPIKYEQMEKTYDYVIVLGGGAQFSERINRVVFNTSADRLFQAVRLYKKAYANKIVLSGGSGRLLEQEHKESEYVKEYLMELGIPAMDIIIESDSRNTKENAENTATLIESDASCLLVTSAWHMRRAKKCFEKAGIQCDPFSTDSMMDQSNSFNIKRFIIPSVETMSAWNMLMKEVLGTIVYRFKGWV